MSPAGSKFRETLVLMTRLPQAGRTKTRLIPALGPEGAAALQREMTAHAVQTLAPDASREGRRFNVCFDGGSVREMRQWLGRRLIYTPQGAGDLGQRLHHAVAAAFRDGADSVVVVGADCPELAASHIDSAFAKLRTTPLVFGPAVDGGYYLIGLRQPIRELFTDIPWGKNQVLAKSVAAAGRAGLAADFLPALADVDGPDDLAIWKRVRESLRTISVIIPTLNEAAHLPSTLAAVMAAGPTEVIVADGGSTDGTLELAARGGAKIVTGPPGRAQQMNAGAAAACGGILLFLHGDTLLPGGFPDAMHVALARPDVVGGAFGFALSESFAGKPLVEWATNLRSRWLQMPYGDQALFVRRGIFKSLGGFERLPLMEDYAFVRRLRRLGRVVTLPERARTSGRRWRQLGFWRTTLINQLVILGYRLGVQPERLAKFYRGSS